MKKMLSIVCIAAASFGVAPSSGAKPSAIPWVPFQWSSITSGGKTYEKGALLVPVRIRSFPQTYCMQLDTGTPDTLFYAVPKNVQDAIVGDWNKGQPFSLPLHIGATVLTFTGLRIVASPSAEMNQPCPIIGTLGQSAFLNLVVFVDFVHQKIAFMRPAEVRDADLTDVAFVHMTARNDELFISISIDGVQYPNDFFYDSGSSLFPLLTIRSVWNQLTGHSVDEHGNAVIHVDQWSKTATVVGAKISGAMSIGPVTIPSPMAWVQTGGGAKGSDLADANYPVKGIVGNAPFFDCCMIVIDAPKSRFGIKKLH
jgi:hypothetical protein